MGGGMMLVLQIEGYSKQALATLIAMLGRIEIARANAVLHRATTMKTSLTAAAVIATLTLATTHAETVIPDTVIPHIADVSHAETATADFFYRFFTAKSQKNLKKTMSFFSRDLKTYTDATLGWGLDGFDAVNGIFAKYMPTWPEASMSYPTKILGGNGSVLVQMTVSAVIQCVHPHRSHERRLVWPLGAIRARLGSLLFAWERAVRCGRDFAPVAAILSLMSDCSSGLATYCGSGAGA